MARRRKPGETADAPKAPKPSKRNVRRGVKKPSDAVLGYMRERYGNY